MDEFTNELNRLLALPDITPEQAVIARRYYSQKEREGMPESDFCGPHKSFPITSAADVSNAAHLIGHADDPAAVKACIKRKAKSHGWSIPDSWKDDKDDDDKKDRVLSSVPASDNPDSHTNHEPFVGAHSHHHPHMDGYGHEHHHEHFNDNHHDHRHIGEHHRAEGTPQPDGITSEKFSIYAPILRFDSGKWEVDGQATAEVPDAYGTIFGYYPKAWLDWRGNMREQHDSKKAVGRAIEVLPNDEERSIQVKSRVSRGARDTWLKIEDNVLTGYSASIIPDPEYGNDISKWPKKIYNGKSYPYLPRYTVAELSYVDNPATPGCDITLVRSNGELTEILDNTEEAPPAQQTTQNRAMDNKMHQSIAHTLRSAYAQMDNCGCDGCRSAQKMIDPDADGDIDLGGYDDPDGDAASLGNGDMTRNLEPVIERLLHPVYQRLSGLAGQLAKSQPTNQVMDGTLLRAVEERVKGLETILGDIKKTVDRIDNTPLPGAPVQATSQSLGTKQLPTEPVYEQRPSYGAVYDAVARLSQSGELDTVDAQVNAVAAALSAQRGRR